MTSPSLPIDNVLAHRQAFTDINMNFKEAVFFYFALSAHHCYQAAC
jgi:hypothetical protein